MSKYFVSYFWKTFWKSGCGMSIVDSAYGMETARGLLEVQEVIKENGSFRKCVVINYKKLGDCDVEEQTSESL